ncbi:MAG: class I SAM-dependent methyltransferase [Chitinophagaceae bacterium]|nr:class I SAM-dependent methyltransferase [Chitinophagaceae bacterium]
MLESLVPLLRCPVTHSELTVKLVKRTAKLLDGENRDIMDEAVLYATADWFYPVIGGIPRLTVEAFLDHASFLKQADADYENRKTGLLNKYPELIKEALKKNKRTKKSFAKEWSVYQYDADKTWDADDEAMVARFLKETDEIRETLAHKIIFDAGCGNGKLDVLIAPFCKTLVAMDFADSMKEAYKRNQFANLHFIEGDVHYPPLLFGHFDLVHCSGVLIHTANAAHAFNCIEPIVKEAGKLSVWLYHPRRDVIHNLFNWIRKFTSKLPLGVQYYLYRFTIFPVSYCIKRWKGNKQNSREMMVNILDWFTPQYRSEHEHAEVADWFARKGYTKNKVTTTDDFGFNMIGVKP